MVKVWMSLCGPEAIALTSDTCQRKQAYRFYTVIHPAETAEALCCGYSQNCTEDMCCLFMTGLISILIVILPGV